MPNHCSSTFFCTVLWLASLSKLFPILEQSVSIYSLAKIQLPKHALIELSSNSHIKLNPGLELTPINYALARLLPSCNHQSYRTSNVTHLFIVVPIILRWVAHWWQKNESYIFLLHLGNIFWASKLFPIIQKFISLRRDLGPRTCSLKSTLLTTPLLTPRLHIPLFYIKQSSHVAGGRLLRVHTFVASISSRFEAEISSQTNVSGILERAKHRALFILQSVRNQTSLWDNFQWLLTTKFQKKRQLQKDKKFGLARE